MVHVSTVAGCKAEMEEKEGREGDKVVLPILNSGSAICPCMWDEWGMFLFYI